MTNSESPEVKTLLESVRENDPKGLELLYLFVSGILKSNSQGLTCTRIIQLLPPTSHYRNFNPISLSEILLGNKEFVKKGECILLKQNAKKLESKKRRVSKTEQNHNSNVTKIMESNKFALKVTKALISLYNEGELSDYFTFRKPLTPLLTKIALQIYPQVKLYPDLQIRLRKRIFSNLKQKRLELGLTRYTFVIDAETCKIEKIVDEEAKNNPRKEEEEINIILAECRMRLRDKYYIKETIINDGENLTPEEVYETLTYSDDFHKNPFEGWSYHEVIEFLTDHASTLGLVVMPKKTIEFKQVKTRES